LVQASEEADERLAIQQEGNGERIETWNKEKNKIM